LELLYRDKHTLKVESHDLAFAVELQIITDY
jgi:hypothetical protein